MASGRKETRAFDRDGLEGNGPLPGRAQREHRGVGPVGKPEGASLSQPDSAHEQPTRKDWNPRTSGAADTLHLHGSIDGRGKCEVPGRIDATSKGGGGVSDRRQLGHSKALRAHTTISSPAIPRKRKGDGPKSRDAADEASRVGQEDDSQIGNRQRSSKSAKEGRESFPKSELAAREKSGQQKRVEPKREKSPSSEVPGSEERAGQERRGGPQERSKRRAQSPPRRVFISGEARSSRDPYERTREERSHFEAGGRRSKGSERSEERGPERKRRKGEREGQRKRELEEMEKEKEALDQSGEAMKEEDEVPTPCWEDADALVAEFRDWLLSEPPYKLVSCSSRFSFSSPICWKPGSVARLCPLEFAHRGD